MQSVQDIAKNCQYWTIELVGPLPDLNRNENLKVFVNSLGPLIIIINYNMVYCPDIYSSGFVAKWYAEQA